MRLNNFFVYLVKCHSTSCRRHDRGGRPATGEAQGALGDDTGLPGLRRHGRLLLPCRPRQPGRHGLQVPAVTPSAGGAAAHPAGTVGLPGGPVAGAAGPTPPDRHGVRLRSGHVPLQPDGDGVAVVQHLPDADLHQHAQLEPLLLSTGCAASPAARRDSFQGCREILISGFERRRVSRAE